jgi:amino acid adenylation domain-containing protein
VYNEAEAFRLAGAVDPDAFRRALDALYQQHAALRTVVVPDAAGLPQVAILPPGPFPLEQLDLRGQPLDEARRLGERAAEATVRRRFDLHSGPLVRGSLIRCGDQEWIFVLVTHHLVSDDDSVRLMFDELSLFYGDDTPAAPPGDLLRAQRSLELPAGHPQRAVDLEYWARTAGGFAGMDIPTDRPPPDRSTYAGSRHVLPMAPLPMAPGWFKRVQTTAMRLHASPFAVVTAALSVVLARLSQTEDVAIATTVNMRSEAEAEDLVGYFLKTIPLRLRIPEDGTAAELVRQAHETVMGAIAHTSVEFDEIVSAAGRADSSRSSPFRVALELHYEVGELRLPDVTATRLPLHPGTSAFDFTFHVYAVPGISGYVEYSTERFDEATAGGVAGAFAAVLRQLCDQLCDGTDGPVAGLTLEHVSDATVLAQWESGADLDETTVTPLPDAVRARAALHPDRPAVVFDSETLTFAQLVRHADLLGAALAAAGVSQGEAVGVAVRRSGTQIAAAFGAWSTGAVCAALDPDLPEDRLRRMMHTAGIRVVLVDLDTAARPAFAGVTTIPAHVDGHGLSGGPVAKASADDTAYLIFTSGTSGDPKPVAIRHASLSAFGQAMDRLVYGELPEHARVAVNAPFSFDASWQGTQLLRAGHTIYPVPDPVRADSESMVEFLREHRIEVLDGTPTHVASLVDAGLLQLTVLRVLVVGGEVVPVGLWRSLAAADLSAVNVYGPTEFTVNATGCRIEPSRPHPTIGRPLAGVTARVLDPQKRRVPVGFPGELHLSGLQLAVGYAGHPERTAERFLTGADGSRQYVTGDLVRWRGDGSLDFLGRRDGQVKLRGYRIELAEIARVLRSAPGVADAAAVVVGQGSPSAVLHAALVLADPAPELSAVRAFAATQLPGYMVPASFAVLPRLPRTTGGKLDLAAVAGSARSALSVPSTSSPSTPTRRRLAAIWAALLECQSVRDEDDFFALGGNSLFASRLVRRVETEFKVRLPLHTIFGNGTLAAMADALDALDSRGTTAGMPGGDSRDLVVPLVAGNGEPPLVLLHPLGGTLFAYQPLLRLLPPEVPVWGVRSPTAAGAGEEHPDVTSMVRAYATQLCERLPGRSASLFGWSLGGLIALAVAAELEQRGFRIGFVEIWDVGAGTEEALDESEMVRSAFRAVYGDGAQPGRVAIDDRLLEANLQVIRHQTALFLNWHPASIRADVHVVYAEPSLRDGSVVRTDWGRFASGHWTEATVRAGHYEMMRDPAVAESAQGLLARLRNR